MTTKESKMDVPTLVIERDLDAPAVEEVKGSRFRRVATSVAALVLTAGAVGGIALAATAGDGSTDTVKPDTNPITAFAAAPPGGTPGTASCNPTALGARSTATYGDNWCGGWYLTAGNPVPSNVSPQGNREFLYVLPPLAANQSFYQTGANPVLREEFQTYYYVRGDGSISAPMTRSRNQATSTDFPDCQQSIPAGFTTCSFASVVRYTY